VAGFSNSYFELRDARNQRPLHFGYKLDSEKSFCLLCLPCFQAVSILELPVKLDNPLTQGTRVVFVALTVSMAPVTRTPRPPK